ncbi:MAG: hypothetical protein M1832_001458 [Thelocarpon impressellum]|nr:MAG: hypothetical protein M1832_001458 [Thelocarpon impressellum]
MRFFLALLLCAVSLADYVDVVFWDPVEYDPPTILNRPSQVYCTRLPAGACCNDIFGFWFAKFYGLQPGNVATTWHREASMRQMYDAENWDSRDERMRPDMYGCGGQNKEVGLMDADGRWESTAFAITGAMWLDCGQQPLGTLARAFHRNPRDSLATAGAMAARSSVAQLGLSIMQAYGMLAVWNWGQCEGPRRKRARGAEAPSGAHPKVKLADDATLDALEAEELRVGNGTGAERQLLGSRRLGYMSRFPDVIVVDGVSYSDKHGGDLVYVNAAGQQLDLLAPRQHHRPKKQAAVVPKEEEGVEKTESPDHTEDGL